MKSLLGVLLCVAAATGCSAAGGDNGDNVDSTADALSAGNWVSPSQANGVVVSDSGLPVCRAPFDGGWQPGKLYKGYCEFGWGGASHYDNTNYQVLNDNNYHWVEYAWRDRYGRAQVYLNEKAVDGGYAGWKSDGSQLGVCQAKGTNGLWHPGKYYAGRCNYAYGGSANDNKGKEIVQEPGTNGTTKVLERY